MSGFRSLFIVPDTASNLALSNLYTTTRIRRNCSALQAISSRSCAECNILAAKRIVPVQFNDVVAGRHYIVYRKAYNEWSPQYHEVTVQPGGPMNTEEHSVECYMSAAQYCTGHATSGGSCELIVRSKSSIPGLPWGRMWPFGSLGDLGRLGHFLESLYAQVYRVQGKFPECFIVVPSRSRSQRRVLGLNGFVPVFYFSPAIEHLLDSQ